MLVELKMQGVGPAQRFSAQFGNRLNVITGDNGLGKSFMLDVAWWCMTGTWPGLPAQPIAETQKTPIITYTFMEKGESPLRMSSRFDFRKQRWLRPRMHNLTSSLVVYARVDGTFAIFDPARTFPETEPAALSSVSASHALHFTKEAVWNGMEIGTEYPCEGLIRDWVRWQREKTDDSSSAFVALEKVLQKLSPHDLEKIEIVEPQRVSPTDSRNIPTIRLPYGPIPVTLASEGMRRILALAYILVWTWFEHLQGAKLTRRRPAKRLVLLIDEVESHLHPRWQRSILPAAMSVANELQSKLQTQLLVTTHSPLVLASLETLFDEDRDKLFLLEKTQDRPVDLIEYPWAKHGDAVGWLTSQIFGLGEARSREGEDAIDAAYAFMRGDTESLPTGLNTRGKIDRALKVALPGDDDFWAQWIGAGGNK